MSRFESWVKPKIVHGKPTKYGWVVYHTKQFKLGKFTDIGYFTFIQARFGVEIQDYVQIGSHCSIYSHNSENNTKSKILIKKNAKIGSHCVILPAKNGEARIIGENAFVGAGVIVNRNIADSVYYVNERIIKTGPIHRKVR